MDTVVLKFGGSSVADNIKLNIVAKKIKKFYDENKKVVVVVSAQGKTTDSLIKEAMSLSSVFVVTNALRLNFGRTDVDGKT